MRQTGPPPSRDGVMSGEVILRAEHVCVEYAGRRPTRAVRDVSFELRRGEVLGIAGESGCGKSTLAYALTRMLRPPAEFTGGSIQFFGRDGTAHDVMALAGEQLREFRWNKVSMVFQSAMNALNPVTALGRQFDDIFRAHRPGMDAAARRARARELMDMVGIDPARLRGFAHELSGGMRQRVVIAMALALEPEIVIMDEPTTALDVVVQREILDEIERLREDLGFSVVFITHDLSLLLEVSDRLAVMYAGQFAEYAPSEVVGLSPAHPYTLGLLLRSRTCGPCGGSCAGSRHPARPAGRLPRLPVRGPVRVRVRALPHRRPPAAAAEGAPFQRTGRGRGGRLAGRVPPAGPGSPAGRPTGRAPDGQRRAGQRRNRGR